MEGKMGSMLVKSQGKLLARKKESFDFPYNWEISMSVLKSVSCWMVRWKGSNLVQHWEMITL